MASPIANGAQRTYTEMLQELKTGPNANRNGYIQLLSQCLADFTCPMTLRKLIEAQHSYEGVKSNQPDNQNIYIKNITAATVGSAFTIATRVVRCAVRTTLLPATLLYSVGKANRYSLTGEVTEDLRRTGHEWVDFGVSLFCVSMGLAKFVKPDFWNGAVDSLKDRYVTRIDARNERDRYVEEQIRIYRNNRRQVNQAWAQGSRPPVLANPLFVPANAVPVPAN